MKTAAMPSLRVEPELRNAVENVLQEGETLSLFMENALRNALAARQAQQAFLARGIAAAQEARASDEYYSADQVLEELDAMLAQSGEAL
ncbi:YlcI/YnfO family protein [Massilia sp. W12]|uniref:YlcI/YnfO family protein n=1 Tax=Massilia sp. W12 TaxID=3126507 RepID=UPI0030CE7A49